MSRGWHEFIVSERELFDRAGLPGVLSDERKSFEYFVMHGCLPMPGGHADGTRFSDSELDAAQRDALDKLIASYTDRFGDPGVGLGPRPT
jgi:hypothetical protein